MDVPWEMAVSFLPEASLILFQPSSVGTQRDSRESLQLHLLHPLSTPKHRVRFDLGVCRYFRKGICRPPECQHHPVMGTMAWGRGFAAFAKVPLGKALILLVGTEGRDLQAAAVALSQALPTPAGAGSVRSCCRKLLSKLVGWQLALRISQNRQCEQ